MQKVGIIGTGKHGSRYAQHILRDVEGLELAGISRRSPVGAEQARDWDTEYFTDWRELVKSREVEAVIAVAPPVINRDIALCCSAEGKPLLMEKPLARNVGEAAEIVEVMALNSCPLTVGQTLRYNPVIDALHGQLPTMGELHSFAVNQRIEPSSLAWHDEPETAGAGVIIHTGVHIFDALKSVTGRKIVRVMAGAKCVHSSYLEDLVVILAELENGVMGTIDVSKVGHARSGRYEFICQNGQLHADQVHLFTKTITHSSIMTEQRFSPQPTILRLLHDWRDFLAGERDNPVTGEDGLYAVKVCDACNMSAREGRWVEVV